MSKSKELVVRPKDKDLSGYTIEIVPDSLAIRSRFATSEWLIATIHTPDGRTKAIGTSFLGPRRDREALERDALQWIHDDLKRRPQMPPARLNGEELRQRVRNANR